MRGSFMTSVCGFNFHTTYAHESTRARAHTHTHKIHTLPTSREMEEQQPLISLCQCLWAPPALLPLNDSPTKLSLDFEPRLTTGRPVECAREIGFKICVYLYVNI